MISFELDEDQRLIQETIRSFCRDKIRPRIRDFERDGEISQDVWREFEELELAKLDIPEALGGAGQSQVTAAIAHEELAFGDAGAAVALFRTQPATAALLELADDDQRRRFFPVLTQRGAFASVAFSEPGVAKGPLFNTSAKRAGDDYVLSGSKRHVLFGDRASLQLVFASVEGEPEGWKGAGVFVVEKGAKGAPRSRGLGLRPASFVDVQLGELRVPGRNRLRGGNNLEAATRAFFARYAVITAARQMGLARAAYEYALQYAEDRKAFGKPIAHFQEIAFRLADMHMDVESSRWMVWRAARALDLGAPDAITWAAKASVHANEAAWRVADWAVQVLGGAGYMKDHPCEKWMRDTKVLALLGAPSEGHLEAIAAAELDGTADLPAHPRIQSPIT